MSNPIEQDVYEDITGKQSTGFSSSSDGSWAQLFPMAMTSS